MTKPAVAAIGSPARAEELRPDVPGDENRRRHDGDRHGHLELQGEKDERRDGQREAGQPVESAVPAIAGPGEQVKDNAGLDEVQCPGQQEKRRDGDECRDVRR